MFKSEMWAYYEFQADGRSTEEMPEMWRDKDSQFSYSKSILTRRLEMVMEYIPQAYCKDCLKFITLDDSSVSEKCPHCGSTNIAKPPVKKGGPFSGGIEKRY
jgi:predicted RNA-binding Zn-ribbon protein involved in translation (DUF1610 family)